MKKVTIVSSVTVKDSGHLIMKIIENKSCIHLTKLKNVYTLWEYYRLDLIIFHLAIKPNIEKLNALITCEFVSGVDKEGNEVELPRPEILIITDSIKTSDLTPRRHLEFL